jgi:N4-gp56 family major capsid protein
MANNFNDNVTQAAIIATAFDNMSVKPLRPNYVFDALAKEKVWNLPSMPNKGDALQFTRLSALSSNTGALDATSTAINGGKKNSYVRVAVSMDAYGDYMVYDTLELGNESFVDALADGAFLTQDQAMNSVNLLARTAIDKNQYSNTVSGTLSSTYHYYASGGGTAGQMGVLKAIDVRAIVADMKADNVKTFEDGYYLAVVDPNVATQLKSETGNAAWGAAVLAGDESVQRRFTGDIGTFEGVRFVVSTECAKSGTGTVSSYFLGQDGVGKAVGQDVRISMKPELEGPHSNLAIMRWNALIGYGIIRREAIRIVSSSQSQR